MFYFLEFSAMLEILIDNLLISGQLELKPKKVNKVSKLESGD